MINEITKKRQEEQEEIARRPLKEDAEKVRAAQAFEVLDTLEQEKLRAAELAIRQDFARKRAAEQQKHEKKLKEIEENCTNLVQRH